MKYWTYMKGEVPGSYEPEALAALPDFGMTTLVCPAQGEIAEKNWRRAGEFNDIIRAVEARQSKLPPSAPLGAPLPHAAGEQPSRSEVDALLDTASTRLFSHVADLMKELETRRDEKSLIISLQRQISALKQELAQARENATILEIRIPRIAELEESQRRDHSVLAQLHSTLTSRDTQIDELRAACEKMRLELGTARHRLEETDRDLSIRNSLVDKLSRDLSEKELSLAKSLGVIRRLEEDLNRLCPPAAEIRIVAERLPNPLESGPLPHVAEERPTNASVFTEDDPPPPPPYLEPTVTESPKAHQALINFLRNIFPGRPH